MAVTNSGPRNLVGELYCLTKPPNPEKHVEAKAIDIVALHDIQQTTDVPWGTGQSGTWLRQLLPKDIRGARILTFHYATEFMFGGSWGNFETAVSELLRSIATARGTVAARRPLVLMCHGLSSLLVEAAVTRMLAEDSNYLQLGEAVKAVIFLNGPQRKSTMVPWTTLLLQITRENLLADPRLEGIIRAWLEKNASPLEKLPLRFKKRSSGIKIISFYGPLGPLHLDTDEELLTLGLKREKKIPRQGCDHQSIAEFTNREDENFQFLVKELKSIIRRENKAGKSSAAQGHENTTEAGHNTESARGVKKAASQRSVVRDTQAPNAHAKDSVTATLLKRKPLPQQTFEASKPQKARPPPDTTDFNRTQRPPGQFARTSGPPGLLATHSVAPLKAETNKVLVQKDFVNNHQPSAYKANHTHPLAPPPKDQVSLTSFHVGSSSNVFSARPPPANTLAPTQPKPATRIQSRTTKTEHHSSNASLPNAQQQSLGNFPPPRRERVSKVLPGTIRAMPPTLGENPATHHIKPVARNTSLPAASLPSTKKEFRPPKASSPTPAHSSRNITAVAGGLPPQHYPKTAQQQPGPAEAQHYNNAGQQHNTPINSLTKANNSGFFGKLFSSSSSNGSKESILRPTRSPGLHQFNASQQPQRPQAISRPPNDTTVRAQNVHPPFHRGTSAPPPQAAHRNGFSPAASQQQRSHHTPSALVLGAHSDVNNVHISNNTGHSIPSSLVPGGRNNLNPSRGPAAIDNNYGGQASMTHYTNTSHPFNPPQNVIGTHSAFDHNDSHHHTATHVASNSFQQYTHHPQYHHDPPNAYYDYRHPGWEGSQHHHPTSSDAYQHSHADANGSHYEPPHQGNSSNGKIGLAAAVGVGGLAVGAVAATAIGNIGDDSDVDNSEGEEEEEGSGEEEVDSSEEEEEEDYEDDEDDEDDDDDDEEEEGTSEEEGVYDSEEGEEEYGEAEVYGSEEEEEDEDDDDEEEEEDDDDDEEEDDDDDDDDDEDEDEDGFVYDYDYEEDEGYEYY